MLEIIAIAKATGHELAEAIAKTMINAHPEDTLFKPNMQQDTEKAGVPHNMSAGRETANGLIGKLY